MTSAFPAAQRCAVIMAGILLALPRVTAATGTDECVARAIVKAPGDTTLAALRAKCADTRRRDGDSDETRWQDCLHLRAVAASDAATADSVKAECEDLLANDQVLPPRMIQSRRTESNPYVITPLRQNYILPYTYNSRPNPAVYEQQDGVIDKEEAKLQISLMVPLTYTDLLIPNDGVYFGFTLKSFWQVYNKDISAPFRETNYRPEVFYQVPLPIASNRGVWLGRLGLEHESNGRTQYLSRSWNRVYVTLGYVRPSWALALQPWYRLPEDKKKDDGDPATPPRASGDDNPDIEDYLGHYEFTGVYRRDALEFTGLFRRNVDEGHGAHEIGLSFPLWGRLRGYAQYFEGHGESLIDYDHKSRRIGLGVLLTDLL